MSEFIWTEDLVKEFMSQFATLHPPHEQEAKLRQFKASKQPKPEWEIGALKFHTPHNWLWDSSVNAYFLRGHTMRFTRQELYEGDNGQGNISIASVKRLSDGEVFTVGDEVEIEGANRMRPIYRFSLDGDTLMVHFHEYAAVSFNMISAAIELATAVYLTPSEIEKLKQLLS